MCFHPRTRKLKPNCLESERVNNFFPKRAEHIRNGENALKFLASVNIHKYLTLKMTKAAGIKLVFKKIPLQLLHRHHHRLSELLPACRRPKPSYNCLPSFVDAFVLYQPQDSLPKRIEDEKNKTEKKVSDKTFPLWNNFTATSLLVFTLHSQS